MRKTIHNGSRAEAAVVVEAEADTSLVSIVREHLGLRSVVRGCPNGECGACRIMLDGKLVASCQLAFRDVPDGAEILARENVENEPLVAATIAAFEAERPTRCRLCVGGLAVTAHHLSKDARAEVSDDAIEAGISHATCMCTGRGSLRRALQKSLLQSR